MRTCTGCKAITTQAELVRVAFDGTHVALDPPRRFPGRGAYVHRRAACVTVAGLARSLRRQVTSADVARIVSQMSPGGDNSRSRGGDQLLETADQNPSGLGGSDAVEITPRIKAKDDRSEDARL